MSASKKRKASTFEHLTKRSAKQKRPNSRDTEDYGQPSLAVGVNPSLATMDPPLWADYLARRTRRFEPELSLVEQEDKRLPVSAIRDTSDFKEARRLENFSEFLAFVADESTNLLAPCTSKGSPHTIVLTGAGLRAADITRALRKYHSKGTVVAKLFAKHIKLQDAAQFVKFAPLVYHVPTCAANKHDNNVSRIGIGVGTPSRLNDLVESSMSTSHLLRLKVIYLYWLNLIAEALSLDALKRIIIDSSHMDVKSRSIFDIKDVYLPLITFLNRSGLKNRYGSTQDRVDILFY
ncbi:MAG: hypothetical protein M1833_007004 [Piccolia ochrophora]|nr:MAG: hypothetical protein M1833_007004 [Piccolia ochrophora]